MDASIQRALNDKLYDKRKVGALELERVVREACANGDHEKVKKIIDQLCHEYAYAVHQPHARNGGLIGLAAAAIALGPEVARYLEEIVPPVLACFTDQDARVRYYACESMYNIAKVAKGEILLFFNEVFDALCKLAADSELSVKNGAELLDRLIKDIVSESAATYVSVLQTMDEEAVAEHDGGDSQASLDLPTAFSLSRFIPLLRERIHVINPFTRMFLVSWITLLDSIPDLELVAYLPAFLGGLFRFLSDPNRDVQVATQAVLERFLAEIKRIAQIKRNLDETKKDRNERHEGPNPTSSSDAAATEPGQERVTEEERKSNGDADGSTQVDGQDESSDGDWVPEQDVNVDHPKVLEILVMFLDSPTEEEIQLTALRWIDAFFEICPEDILPFVPRLLARVLPAMSSDVDQVQQAAHKVNKSLIEYIMSLTGEPPASRRESSQAQPKENGVEATSTTKQIQSIKEEEEQNGGTQDKTPPATDAQSTTPQQMMELDYSAAVNALTAQFLNEHEDTRVAALSWLMRLHRKAPRKTLETNESTFPALMKTLSDPSEAVVTQDLQLLSQIAKNSEDDYFLSFMVNLLQLFRTDRKLLETRGNLIIRQLCTSLSAERIYRTLADCLEKEEDVAFASIMIQNLNNNLITAPELADLRKRLKNLETRDGQTFFVALFRSWCHNAVATFSLCLLAQAYEQAYNLLQIFADLEMTVNMLIQIDKLVQLLESPVFTYLRLQLLEPEKYPYLYKCLYGLLMLLPQSSAFAALKNRLNSVSAIGYLHIAPRPYVISSISSTSSTLFPSSLRFPQKHTESRSSAPSTPAPTYDRPNRLKAREDAIKWVELLEKFKQVQERARKKLQGKDFVALPTGLLEEPIKDKRAVDGQSRQTSASAQSVETPVKETQVGGGHKARSSLSSNFGRLAGHVGSKKTKR